MIIKKAHLMFRETLHTFMFFILRPWNRAVRVLGIHNIDVPFYIRIGIGSRLIAPKGSDKIVLERGVWVGRDVELNASSSGGVVVRQRTTIQDRCKIQGQVTIERDCILAPNVFISSSTHNAFKLPYLNIRDQDGRFENIHSPVHIEEDVWIGVNTFIKSGVCVGRGAVVGANSVVTEDILPYDIFAGIPAKKIKSRLNLYPLEELNAADETMWPYFYRGFFRPSMQIVDRVGYLLVSSNASQGLLVSLQSDGVGELMVFDSKGKYMAWELAEGRLELRGIWAVNNNIAVNFPKIPDDRFQFLAFRYTGNHRIHLSKVKLVQKSLPNYGI